MLIDGHRASLADFGGFDICIVGAGPAGISLALQFCHTPYRVLLLDSGGKCRDRAAQSLSRGEVVNPALHLPPHRYRRRGLGGASAIWGGRCVPFDPIDFAARPWLGLERPWPVTYAEMLPYWRRAQALCQAGHFNYGGSTAVAGGLPPILAELESEDLCMDTIERFSRPTDFGATYGAALANSRNITVLLHATCTDIELNQAQDAVAALVVAQAGGNRLRITAGHFVLAMGGLEIPRLLLASRRQCASGVGNRYDQVGRNYMCHLAAVLGQFTPVRRNSVARGYMRSVEGVYCRRRFAIAPVAQARERIGNAIVRLHHQNLADPGHRSGAMSAIHLGRFMLPFEYRVRLAADAPAGATLRHMKNVLADPLGVVRFGAHYLVRRRFAARKFPSLMLDAPGGGYSLDVHAEQLPSPSSRVGLGAARDRFGLPVLRVDWRYLPQDIRTVAGTLTLLARAVAAGGHGELSFDADTLEADLLRDGAYGGHHLGATRMADSPLEGVVDAQCRVHGVANLFVASGAVFPTSGQANPTLTIVALALRLSDYLKRKLSLGSVLCIARPGPGCNAQGTALPQAVDQMA